MNMLNTYSMSAGQLSDMQHIYYEVSIINTASNKYTTDCHSSQFTSFYLLLEVAKIHFQFNGRLLLSL